MNRKVAVVLGINGTLGSALISRFSDDFSCIGVDQHSKSDITHLESYFSCDFNSRSDINKTVTQLCERQADELTIISTIGYFSKPTFVSHQPFDENDLYKSIQINLIGVSHFVGACLHHFSQQATKIRVVIVGSAASQVGSRDLGYGVSKAGLNGLVTSLSKSFSNQGAVVIGVNPGIFESPMSESVSEERQADAVRQTHINRKGRLDEIVEFVDYVAFSSPDYLTGNVLNINGGQCR